MRRAGIVVGAVALLVLTAWMGFRLVGDKGEREMTEPSLPKTCRNVEFEDVSYVVCEVGPGAYDIMLHRADATGKPLGSLDALAAIQPFVFAMNAGMYHEDMSPVGLHVEDGVETAPLNLADAEGNFFLKPNGVFYVDREGRAGVLESGAFATARPDVRMATQSGPMLVIDGRVHPRFEPNGTSRYIRNGVGVRDARTAVFAISRTEVSLGSFARFFHDELGCANALFFDGAISALHDGKRYVIGGEFRAGPMVAITEK